MKKLVLFIAIITVFSFFVISYSYANLPGSDAPPSLPDLFSGGDRESNDIDTSYDMDYSAEFSQENVIIIYEKIGLIKKKNNMIGERADAIADFFEESNEKDSIRYRTIASMLYSIARNADVATDMINSNRNDPATIRVALRDFTEFSRNQLIQVNNLIENVPAGECIVTGCSGEICAGEEVTSTCEFRQEYVCYQDAECIRQEDGTCGWTISRELLNCLESYNNDYIERPPEIVIPQYPVDNQSTNQTVNQSTNQTTNQTVNQIPNQTVTETCYDTDGGVNYYLRGMARKMDSLGNTFENTDTCVSTMLNEYQCSGTNIIFSSYSCPYGCLNGACEAIKPPVEYGKTVYIQEKTTKIVSVNGIDYTLTLNFVVSADKIYITLNSENSFINFGDTKKVSGLNIRVDDITLSETDKSAVLAILDQ